MADAIRRDLRLTRPGFSGRQLCQFTAMRRAWQFGAMAGRLAGKRALVTAAAQGIGRATPRTPNGWRGFGASTITGSIIGSLGRDWHAIIEKAWVIEPSLLV